MIQLSIFDCKPPVKVDKPIRLIELFAGIGSQAKALKNIGANFEHYRVCEFDKYAVASYNAVHGTNFATSDIRALTAEDLGIKETDKYFYIMTYSFPCQDLSLAGKQRGMEKGSQTRSSLLWEVERLLGDLAYRGGAAKPSANATYGKCPECSRKEEYRTLQCVDREIGISRLFKFLERFERERLRRSTG